MIRPPNQRDTQRYLDYLEPMIGATVPMRDLTTFMFEKDFVWLIANDDNRIADGLDIRYEWCERKGLEIDSTSCSFLEVLIGISRRMSFMMSEPPEGWAWQLLINLGLHRMYDPMLYKMKQDTDAILDRVIWRTYGSDGEGGFFPLSNPQKDQKEVEIWYQMDSYIGEAHPEL